MFPNLAYACMSQLQNQVTTLKSVILPRNDTKIPDNCFINVESEKFHKVISKIGEGAISVQKDFQIC